MTTVACFIKPRLVCTVPMSGGWSAEKSGVTVEALAAILAALGVGLGEFFKPFGKVVRPRTPRRRSA